MSQEIELLTEIRDLLQVIAEKDLAKRDKKLRATLRMMAKGKNNALAVHLMDGTRSPAAIVKEVGIDQGQLSRFVNALANANLIGPDKKHPKLLVKIPLDFFEQAGEGDE